MAKSPSPRIVHGLPGAQVKFRKPVVPGDTLVMEVEVKKFREKAGASMDGMMG